MKENIRPVADKLFLGIVHEDLLLPAPLGQDAYQSLLKVGFSVEYHL